SARQPGPTRSSHPLRRADGRRTARVRVLHERRDVLPLLLRALPDEPPARVVRLRGHSDTDQSAASGQMSLTCQLPRGQLPTPKLVNFQGGQRPTPKLVNSQGANLQLTSFTSCPTDLRVSRRSASIPGSPG